MPPLYCKSVKMRLTFVNAEGETDDRTVVWGEAMAIAT
jgi:hypothetical protein